MIKCISQYYLANPKEINLNFLFEKCAVETVTSIPDSVDENINEYRYLRISIQYELKEFESVTDGLIFSRPRYLNLLGIISFLIDEPFDVFSFYSSSKVEPRGIEGIEVDKTEKLLIEGVDLSEQLSELIKVLNSSRDYEKDLVFSLLDRWRKGRYLEQSTDVSLLYNDEATLAYFHVLELLADQYSNSLIKESKKIINKFVEKFNGEILSLNDQALENENNAKSKLISDILKKDISVRAKLSFLLKEFNLYNEETAFWIKSLIKSRNSVAHGRRVNYKKAIFPVQPFFPLISDSLYPLHFVRILTAKVISDHLNISLFSEKWEYIENQLIKSDTHAKIFIQNNEFKNLEYLSESEEKLILGGLNYYIVSKKIKPKNCKSVYDFYLDTEIENKNFLSSNVDALVLLYEALDEHKMEEKLKTAIINIHKLDCNPHLRFRDTIYFLEFHDFNVPKLESLIIENEIK